MENNYKIILKETLKDTSSFVYNILKVYDNKDCLISQVHEDGISSIILKQIAKLKTDNNLFVKIKSLEVIENKTGIDFDIWIGINDEDYIRFIVQAKNFGNKTKVTDSYSINKEQCLKLIDYSKKEHIAFPLYFLYQYIEDKDLKKNHFSFLPDFKDEYSSVTFTSAYNILKLYKNSKIRFSDIHENDFVKQEKNNYDFFEHNNLKIGLPLYLLSDISPRKVYNYKKSLTTKTKSSDFLFLNKNYPLEYHKINAQEIERLYGHNDSNQSYQIKNLIIINDKLDGDRELSKKTKT